ncbi:hypothetical protein ONS95_010008 [Cadophora gregata]|uniref:uncharacterized protein n=1 Tax=Cadophora gregata TaxID=51156 RepID=UPI0026DAAABE|nr:uncharacterized protein ONS95_010008 [Cadophora gregata]KAK0121722.1 hypothetical protein ONS95_010008 [Cadophora gregata]
MHVARVLASSPDISMSSVSAFPRCRAPAPHQQGPRPPSSFTSFHFHSYPHIDLPYPQLKSQHAASSAIQTIQTKPPTCLVYASAASPLSSSLPLPLINQSAQSQDNKQASSESASQRAREPACQASRRSHAPFPSSNQHLNAHPNKTHRKPITASHIRPITNPLQQQRQIHRPIDPQLFYRPIHYCITPTPAPPSLPTPTTLSPAGTTAPKRKAETTLSTALFAY